MSPKVHSRLVTQPKQWSIGRGLGGMMMEKADKQCLPHLKKKHKKMVLWGLLFFTNNAGSCLNHSNAIHISTFQEKGKEKWRRWRSSFTQNYIMPKKMPPRPVLYIFLLTRFHLCSLNCLTPTHTHTHTHTHIPIWLTLLSFNPDLHFESSTA